MNDRGQTLFWRTLGTVFAFEDDDIHACWGDRTSAGGRNTYRRLLRYVDEAYEALHIDSVTLDTAAKAERALMHACRWLATSRPEPLSPSVVETAKNAACVMYSYNTAWTPLAHSRPLRAEIKRLKMARPKVVRPLRLPLPIVKIWRYLRQLPPSRKKNRITLVRVCVCQARLLGRLRYTELAQLDAEASDPTPTGWRFSVRLKGRPDLTEIEVPRLREDALDPVRHLERYRDVLRVERARHGRPSTSFWTKADGKPMSTAHLRKEGSLLMQAAGTQDRRGYMLKHAFVTALRDAGMLADDLAAYARHRPGTNSYVHYLDTSERLEAGMASVVSLK